MWDIENLFFRDTGGWLPDHFHNAVYIRLPSSYSAWKSDSSRVMAAQISVPCWGNLTLPVPDMAISPSCVIASSPSSRSYPSSSPIYYQSSKTGDLLPTPIQATFSPQHINELLPTVNMGTSFLSHIWQRNLHTRVWMQPVSTWAVRFFSLIRTLTMGSAVFTGDLEKELALKFHPLIRFPDTSRLCVLVFCIYSPGLVF